jgi:hypothetical protein
MQILLKNLRIILELLESNLKIKILLLLIIQNAEYLNILIKILKSIHKFNSINLNKFFYWIPTIRKFVDFKIFLVELNYFPEIY